MGFVTGHLRQSLLANPAINIYGPLVTRELITTEAQGAIRTAIKFSDWVSRAAVAAMPRPNEPSRKTSFRSAWNSLSCCETTGQMFPDYGPNTPVERVKIMFKGVQKSNLRIKLVAGLVVAAAFGFASASAAAPSGSSNFTAIDVSGAGTGVHQGTVATIIDAAGDVAGIYRTSNNDAHAFVLPSGGVITTFDAPGEADGTFPIGFDTAGDIVGLFEDASNRIHGFLRAASTGTITVLDVTGEDTGKMEGTFPICINGSGEIAGDYSTTLTTSSGTNSFSHGFVRSASGTITTFDAEPLPTTYGSTNPGTYVIAINASGMVAGFYIDGVGAEHGFLRSASGTITTFEAPNAGTGSEQGTIVTGIDASGDVIGAYADSNNAIHGFVRNASTGTITVIDAPGAGALTYQGTYPDAIDAAGDISGSFTDANNVVHGFVLPANGTITTYDAPGAVASDALRSAANAKLNSKLRQLGKSYGLSHKPRRSNSPLVKLRSLLGRVGAVTSEGTGLLNGNGPNPSGTASYGNLLLNSVNASGEIVGLFTDGNYVFYGYLRATNGSITTISDSGAGTAAEQGTGALAINDSGMIAGTYADSNSVLHGFLYNSSALTATTTSLTPVPTPNPSVYQEPVTLTAAVSSTGGAPPNGENVTFMSGTTSLGTAQLTGGTASLTTTSLPVGTDSITAVYGGDSDFAGSTSAAVSQTVNQASSSTTLKSSLNPSTSGQSVTFTANISGQFSGVATGTVTFNNGNSSLGSGSVSNNMATLTTTALPVGTDTITAVYNGDSNFTGSTSSTLSQVVNALSNNPVPVVSGLSPAFTSAGGAAFTLTVSGSGFVSSSTVYWGSTALTTTYVSATSLTAQVPATDIASAGTTAITVQTPTPGGGTSNSLQFEVDSGTSGSGPTFTTLTAMVAPGSTASYSVTLPSGATNVSVTCLNLPMGASCSYSSSAGAVTIATSATTPAGTYQITVVFTETLPGAATGFVLLPFLVLPLLFIRKKLAARGVWLTACLVLALMAGVAGAVSCGGGGSGPAPTHQVTSSGVVTLTVQ